MATLKELQALMLNIPGVSEETVVKIIVEMQRSLPGEKLYIPAPDTSKREAIERAVRTLPTAVVAERFGITARYARKMAGITKKRN